MSFKVLDLFAGCGGLSCGLEMAGFEVIAANDLFEQASETHKLNHKKSKFFLGSITEPEVKESIIEYVTATGCDVIVGGPPCQAYSLAGKRDVDDARGHLFEDYVEMVGRLQPKIFVMENVKGLLSMTHDRDDLSGSEKSNLEEIKHLEIAQRALRLRRKQAANTERFSFGDQDAAELDNIADRLGSLRKSAGQLRVRVVDRIVARFAAINYRVEYRLLNAADYGVAQRRERVVFIGTRLDVPIKFPVPTHSEKQEGVVGLFEKATLPWVTTHEVVHDLEDLPENLEFNHEFTRHSPDFTERLRGTAVGASVYGGFADAWYRQPPNVPSRTVKENHGGVFVHYKHPRVMTPRELARLQSFPDSFRFFGGKSKILVQIGNAVPPLLGRAIGVAVREMLNASSVAVETPRRRNAKASA